MITIQELLLELSEKIKNEINCQLPARVEQVNEDGTVNVVAIRNDEIEDCVITVPVIRPETARAYIQLAIKKGDRGVIKFCDKSIEDYRAGDEKYNGDNRTHSISDGIFQIGFLPDSEKFVYPDGEIVIGLKNQTFTMAVDAKGNLTMAAKNINITAAQATITSPVSIIGDVTVDGNVTVSKTVTAATDVVSNAISLKTHIHGGVTGGTAKTGAPE